MKPSRLGRVRVGLRYLWAAPNSLLGLVGAGLMLALGGRLAPVAGTLECSGGRLAAALTGRRGGCAFGAITLGHVVLGLDPAMLARLRAHEHVHVRQYERWGPAFLPAYALAGLWQWLQGRCPYADNPFEREAMAAATVELPACSIAGLSRTGHDDVLARDAAIIAARGNASEGGG